MISRTVIICVNGYSVYYLATRAGYSLPTPFTRAPFASTTRRGVFFLLSGISFHPFEEAFSVVWNRTHPVFSSGEGAHVCRMSVRLATCTVDETLLDLEEVKPDHVATTPNDIQILLVTSHIRRDWLAGKLPDGCVITLAVFCLDVGKVVGRGGKVRSFGGRFTNILWS
jgi:hypothetical protein